MSDDDLHLLAREYAARLTEPDKKQLRFNEIVNTTKAFYPAPHREGIKELVVSCDKGSPLYVRKEPMWDVLQKQFRWMVK